MVCMIGRGSLSWQIGLVRQLTMTECEDEPSWACSAGAFHHPSFYLTFPRRNH